MQLFQNLQSVQAKKQILHKKESIWHFGITLICTYPYIDLLGYFLANVVCSLLSFKEIHCQCLKIIITANIVFSCDFFVLILINSMLYLTFYFLGFFCFVFFTMIFLQIRPLTSSFPTVWVTLCNRTHPKPTHPDCQGSTSHCSCVKRKQKDNYRKEVTFKKIQGGIDSFLVYHWCTSREMTLKWLAKQLLRMENTD